ncbi:MAG: thioredoxin [Candidatus Roizmanbacteria bacterium]|nr:MAG: thioredoxin [Candidatus Roizmanbacteria bacterium]
MIKVTKEDFQQEVLDKKGIVFVDFYAQWCGPCKLTAPILEEISKGLTEVKFVKVDVDAQADLASQYSIFSIPTFFIFKNGKVVSQFTGAMSKESFLSEIKKVTG